MKTVRRSLRTVVFCYILTEKNGLVDSTSYHMWCNGHGRVGGVATGRRGQRGAEERGVGDEASRLGRYLGGDDNPGSGLWGWPLGVVLWELP